MLTDPLKCPACQIGFFLKNFFCNFDRREGMFPYGGNIVSKYTSDNIPYGATTFSLIFTKKDISLR